MSSTDSAPQTSPRDESGDRILGIVNYVLAFVALTSGITLLIAAVLAYVRKEQASPWLKSHFEYQIATFWYALAFTVVGVLTSIILIGFLILFVGWVWLLIRAAVGIIRLIDGRGHDNPWGLLF